MGKEYGEMKETPILNREAGFPVYAPAIDKKAFFFRNGFLFVDLPESFKEVISCPRIGSNANLLPS